jgi:endonuclease/exonuclease/phosphatase (EEP) superfamily protein YafD
MITKILNLKYVHLSLSTLFVLGALICIFPPDLFLFKIGAQFAVQIMLSYMAFGLIFLMLKSYRLMFTSFACCAGLCLFLKYTTNSEMAPAQASNEETIHVAHFNISATDDYQFMVDQILLSGADLISLQEVTPDWNIVLQESLNTIYPYSKTVVRFDPFGLAVYSKHPLSNIDTFVCEGVPNIMGTVELKNTGKDICFITSHALPPFYSSDYKKLRKHLRRIAEFSNESSCPVLTMGDYNAVPWSYEIQDFRSASNLNDSRRGFFPNSVGSFSVFQLPSDHIFYSKELKCIQFDDMDDPKAGHIGVKGAYQFTPQYSSL